MIEFHTKSKKSQAVNALVIIIMIMVFFLIYLYYLPPETKEQIFTNSTSNSEIVENNLTGSIILHERIGRIYPEPLNKYEHPITSFSAYFVEKYINLKHLEGLYVYANVFDKNEVVVKFEIPKNYKIASDLLISPNIFVSNAPLKFYFNGRLVYVGKEDFRIPKDLVKEKNVLIVTAMDVGFNLLKSNYAKFSLDIFANIIDTTNAEQSIPIFLPMQEVMYCDYATVEYFLDCVDNPKNRLLIKLNDDVLYNASPDCRRLYRLHIDCNHLKHGQNDLVVKSLGGNYFFTKVSFYINTLKNVSQPLYFDIPEDIYNDLDDYKLNLTIKFVNPSNKNVILDLNGIEREIKAKDYSFVINPYVKENNNYIILKPDDIVDVSDLIIIAKKK